MPDQRLADDFTEPTERMPVATLKRLAADAGVRDLRGLEKGQLPAVIKRARLDTHGVDWRVDVQDLAIHVETEVAAQADANGMAAPVSVKVKGPRRVGLHLPEVEPDENGDGSDRSQELDEDFVVCTLAQGASLMLVDGLATHTLEPDEGLASEPVTVGVLIDAIETVAMDASLIEHERGNQVDLAHPRCELRAEERPKGHAAKPTKQAVVHISWGQ